MTMLELIGSMTSFSHVGPDPNPTESLACGVKYFMQQPNSPMINTRA